jgi:hypothetical protein
MPSQEIRYILDREGYVVAAKAEQKPIDDPHALGEPCDTHRAPAQFDPAFDDLLKKLRSAGWQRKLDLMPPDSAIKLVELTWLT